MTRQTMTLAILGSIVAFAFACTVGPDVPPEPSTDPSAQSPGEQKAQPEAASCASNGGCQPVGTHCCTAQRLFDPVDCTVSDVSGDVFSGYVCGTCIPAQFCQPTGDHCCSARHTFLPRICGNTVAGKQYSGYMCN